MLLSDHNGCIAVMFDIGPSIEYAFFMTDTGRVTTSNPELIEQALKQMRLAMVLDDLADV